MTPSGTLGIAVAGVGRIGRMHARIIAEQIPEARLVGVYDISPDVSRDVASNLGVDAAASIDELLASPDVDALAICTATSTHSELIIRAAAAGKAVFCEKPVSLSLGEVDEAIAAVDAAGVPFMVGFNRRFDPGHAAVRRAVHTGEVGEVTIARITSRDPSPPPIEYVRVSGGIWVDMLIHDFDMANFIVGSPVVQVWAQGGALFDAGIREAGDFDTAVAVLTHESGAITTIDASRMAVYGYDQRVEALGTKGMALSDNKRVNNAQVYREDASQLAPLQYFFLERYADSYRIEWQAFADYVLGGGPSPVSGAEGRAPIVMAIAAALSAKDARPVRLEEIG